MIDTSASLFWIATAVALLLFLLLALAEYRRYGRGSRLVLRLLLLLLALTALYLAFLKPVYRARGAAATILLHHADEQLLDSLLEVYPAAQVLSLQAHTKYPQLEGLSYLSRYAAAGSRMFVVGEGFPEDQLSYLQPYSISYLPGSRSPGLLSMEYNKLAARGDTLLVQGRWRRPANHKLVLALGSVPLDSLVSEGVGVSAFSLRAPLSFSGSRAYRLYHIGQQGDTLETYYLPLQVQEAASYRMALLTAYPEAETKYLKEYLQQQGFALHYLAQLAPGVAVQEWLNLSQTPFRFQQQALREWDMLLLSSGYFSAMAPHEQQQLSQAVAEHGTGLLLLADEETSRIGWQGSTIGFLADARRDTLWVGGKRVPLVFKPLRHVPAGWQVVLQGERGIAAIGRRWGLGQLVVSGITSTYPLVLGGKQEVYEQFWSSQLQAVLAPRIVENSWQLGVASTVHQPLSLELSSRDSLPKMQLLGPDQQPVPLQFWQSPEFPHAWQASFWPREPGWYRAQSAGDTALFRVSKELPSLLKQEQQEQLLRLAALQQGAAANGVAFEHKPLSRWWFFALFLTAMGVLWLEKKLKG